MTGFAYAGRLKGSCDAKTGTSLGGGDVMNVLAYYDEPSSSIMFKTNLVHTLKKGDENRISSTTDHRLTIYPNPSDGNFQVEVRAAEASTPASLRLLDATSRVIQSLNLADHHIDGAYRVSISNESLEAGMYYIELKHHNQTSTHKVIVE